MKKMLNFKYVIVGFLLVLCGACSDFLDLEPKNKIPGESVLSDPNGIKSFLADLYYGSPIEDFVYMPAAGLISMLRTSAERSLKLHQLPTCLLYTSDAADD